MYRVVFGPELVTCLSVCHMYRVVFGPELVVSVCLSHVQGGVWSGASSVCLSVTCTGWCLVRS